MFLIVLASRNLFGLFSNPQSKYMWKTKLFL